MKIKNHKLPAPANHEHKSPNKRKGTMKPIGIMMHYTASGGENGEGDAEYLSRASSRASAQIVIGREGDIHQLMGLNEIAWHAGKSKLGTMVDLNNGFIGIELDNWGYLDSEGKSHTGTVVPEEFRFEGKRGPHSVWESYRDAQLEAAENVVSLICEYYDIEYLIGHEDAAPGRKSDPGPALDRWLESIREKYGLRGPSASSPATKVRLNLRASASRQSTILTVIPKGAPVEFIEETYPGWYKIKFGSRIGYVVGKYLTR